MIAGWQITAAIALGASVVAFGTGWQVRAWKCESALLDAQDAEAKAFEDQLVHQHDEATSYETESAAADVQSDRREEIIRTVYKDRVISPGCAADPVARGVLDDAVQAANARAGGKPGAAVPEPAGTP